VSAVRGKASVADVGGGRYAAPERAVPLEQPRPTFRARYLAAEEPQDDLSVRAHERGIGKLSEQPLCRFNRSIRQEVVAAFDHEAAALRQRDDGLNTTLEWTRHDPIDLVPCQRPDELSGIHTPCLVELTKAIDGRRRKTRSRTRVSE
jgi:hypothetical protein